MKFPFGARERAVFATFPFSWVAAADVTGVAVASPKPGILKRDSACLPHPLSLACLAPYANDWSREGGFWVFFTK